MLTKEELVCPKCGLALGSFGTKGSPCAKCGIFFQTAWKTFEGGKRRQYLKQVEKDEKQRKE